MIYSGLLIYWANGVYAIRLGRFTLVQFFPGWFYEPMRLDHRLAEGMAWHFTFMWLFALNGLLYVGYTSGAAKPRAAAEPPYDGSRRGRSLSTTWAFASNRRPRGSSTGPSGWPTPGSWRWGPARC